MTEAPVIDRIRSAIVFEDYIRSFARDVQKISPGQYLIIMAGYSYCINVGCGGSHRRDQIKLEETSVPANTIRETWYTMGEDRVYYRRRMAGIGDWVEMPPVYFPAPPEPTVRLCDKAGRRLRNHANDGFVYFIADENSNMVKIGVSKNVSARLSELQVSHHHDLKVLHTIPTRNMREDERKLHSRFKKYRIRGEWFTFNGDVAAWIEQDKFAYTKNRMSTGENAPKHQRLRIKHQSL